MSARWWGSTRTPNPGDRVARANGPLRQSLPWTMAALLLVSCERSAWYRAGLPARLVAGIADTVLINSRHAEQLPVRVLDSSGVELSLAGIRYSWMAGDSLIVSSAGRVTCRSRSRSEMRATLGALTTRFLVLCRPIRGFAWQYDLPGVPLVVGGGPQALAIPAIGLDGKPETTIAGRIMVEDTAIAIVRGDSVYPRGPGITGVGVDIGDCLWVVGLKVNARVSRVSELQRREQVFMDSVSRVAEGARREWHIPSGAHREYRLRLVPFHPDTELEWALGTSAMNCVGGARDLHCVALANATVYLRDQRKTSRMGMGQDGMLIVERLDVPFYSRSAAPRPSPWDRLREPACPFENARGGGKD